MRLRQSSLDIYAFLGTYGKDLEGSFIKKIFQIDKSDFLFQIYRSDKKRRNLFVSLTKGVVFYEPIKPDHASQLSLTLRKFLSERKITSVTQINFDRIIRFSLSTGQEMILELFREGNIIITDGATISFALNQREWKNRKIIIGEKYLPPGDRDPLAMSIEEFGETVRKSKASMVQTLATRMNLGGELSEEVLFRAAIDKDKPASDLSSSGEIVRYIGDILKESLNSEAFYYPDTITLSPVRLTHLGVEPERIFNDLNEGYEFYFSNYPDEKAETTPLQRRLESQRKTIDQYLTLAEQYQMMGTSVISSLDTVQRILDEIKSRERSIGSGDSLLKGTAELTSIDAGKKTVILKFMNLEIPLSYDMRATENANLLFSQSKDYRSRAAGAEVAIADTLKSMEFEETRPQKRRRNRHWFETYRWFFSSEGLLVISGKDRKTNEKIVKKHMSGGDLYVHADLYGAPSTIIKAEIHKPAGEVTIREACMFAVSQSRAWSAGVGSGSAYWVYPEQVSKTPESGEYVSTGSWIVRGKRNYLFDLPLELEIELYDYNGESIPMIHPPFEEEANEKSVRIIPGSTKRATIIKQVSAALDVAEDEIESILPPGNSDIIE